MKEENERNTQLEKLNKLGTLFLPPALIAGIFGMNIGNFSSTFLSFIFGFLSIIISIRLSELFLLSPEDRIFNKIFYKLLDFINLPQEKFIRFIKKYPKIETIEKSILSFVVLVVILLLSK
jgi:purine-cytosine permease-like protein